MLWSSFIFVNMKTPSFVGLALASTLNLLDGCQTPQVVANNRAIVCPTMPNQSSSDASVAATTQPSCDSVDAESYLRAQIAAMRPTTPRGIRYDARKILMLAVSEDEGTDEPILQAEIARQNPCSLGEANIGVIRTQIYSGLRDGYRPSEITERLVFTDLHGDRFAIHPALTPNLPGQFYTCLPNRSNYYHRFSYSPFPRESFDPEGLINWTLNLNQVPGVAICFSPSIHEPTICGFDTISAYARAHGRDPSNGIMIGAYGAFGSRPAQVNIN